MASSSGGSPPGDTALLSALTGPESSGPRLILEACSPFKVLLANPAWCTLMGYSADEVVGSSVALLHGPLTCCDTLNSLEMAMSGAPHASKSDRGAPALSTCRPSRRCVRTFPLAHLA